VTVQSPALSAAGDTADRPLRRAMLLRGAAALGLGLLTPLAFAPLHLLPALSVGFGGLFLLLQRTPSIREAFLLGWLFGLGSFVVGLSWIAEAFSVDAERFGALAWPALGALASTLALFPATALGAARAVAGQAGGGRLLLAFCACWSTGEWLRGTVLTGFPWNLAGHAWGFADAPLQLAALVGIHGLGLATILVATLPALAFSARRLWPASAAVLGVAGLWMFGALRFNQPAPPDLPGIRLRLVQPEVAQSLKWAPEERARIVGELLALSRAAGTGATPTHVIWPETAVPYLVAEDAAVRAALRTAVPGGGALITGAVRRAPDFATRPAMRNSVLVLDEAGTVVGDGYDKVRLVPFGEYVPLRAWLPGVPKLTDGAVDFSPGPSPVTLSVPGLPPALALICYEAIFPGRLPANGPAPGWLLTVTNDAWFGTSAGPHQHALAARLRAVELGLPMVRVANGGISFVTDAFGRERAGLPLGARGVLDTPLPAALPGGTPYGRFSDAPLLAALAILLTALVLTRRRTA
jgi:apolipoprotein N-acyltransferase